MPSNFDDLISALAEVQARRPGPPPPPMAKAMPAPKPPPAPAGPPVNLHKLLADLRGLKSSIEKSLFASQEERKRTQFIKAMSAAHAQLGLAITAGKISADDAILMEARLHRLAEDGMRAAAASESRR